MLKLPGLFLFGFISFVFTAKAATASDFHSARSAALGGSAHADPMLTDSIYQNPSYLSFMPVYAVRLNYGTYTGDTAGHILNLSAIDGNRIFFVQTGVGYTRREDSSLLHVGVSKQYMNRVSIGLGGKLVSPNDSTQSRFADATASFSWAITEWLKTAFIVDNLFESSLAQGFQREFTLGTELAWDPWIHLYFDPNWISGHSLASGSADGNTGYQFGAELPLPFNVSLRVGGFKNSTVPSQNQRGNGYGLGVGWLLPRLSLDYAFSRVSTPVYSLSHSVEMTFYF